MASSLQVRQVAGRSKTGKETRQGGSCPGIPRFRDPATGLPGHLFLAGPGWAVLNVLTLGRYPRLRKPNRNVDDYMEILFIVMVGVLSVFGLAVLVVKLWPAAGQA